MVQALQKEHPSADRNGVGNTLAPSSGKFRRAFLSHYMISHVLFFMYGHIIAILISKTSTNLITVDSHSKKKK